MILVDTGVWVDHLRGVEPELAEALRRGQVFGHPWVIGELALGGLGNRSEVLQLLQQLPQAELATAEELQEFIGRHRLFGLGIGYVDLQLLASTMLSGDAQLWTRDKKLASAAARFDRAYVESSTSHP